MGPVFWQSLRTSRARGHALRPRPCTVWCVSDGRAGIERQTLAVADALSEIMPVETKVLRVSPRAPQVWLPPTWWPAPLAALPDAQRDQFRAPWPDVWIGNGRRAIPFSLRAKKWSKAKTLVVQLQDPRVDPAHFDLVVPPRHDGLRGANVVETLGAPVWFTSAQLAAARVQFSAISAYKGKVVLVVLGGPSKRHRFDLDRAQAMIEDMRKIAASGAKLLITASRRTPHDVVALFRRFATASGADFFESDAQDGPNPYVAWLARADCALVTEDSTNMITDAAFFGMPVHLLRLTGGDVRFDRLHEGFIEAGVARWFDGELMDWSYQPVKEAGRVAQVIAQRLPAQQLNTDQCP